MSLFNLPQISGLSSFLLPSIFLSPPLRFHSPRISLSIAEPTKNLLFSSYAASPQLSVSSSKQHQARVSLGRADERLGRKKEYEEEEDNRARENHLWAESKVYSRKTQNKFVGPKSDNAPAADDVDSSQRPSSAPDRPVPAASEDEASSLNRPLQAKSTEISQSAPACGARRQRLPIDVAIQAASAPLK